MGFLETRNAWERREGGVKKVKRGEKLKTTIFGEDVNNQRRKTSTKRAWRTKRKKSEFTRG